MQRSGPLASLEARPRTAGVELRLRGEIDTAWRERNERRADGERGAARDPETGGGGMETTPPPSPQAGVGPCRGRSPGPARRLPRRRHLPAGRPTPPEPRQARTTAVAQ